MVCGREEERREDPGNHRYVRGGGWVGGLKRSQ